MNKLNCIRTEEKSNKKSMVMNIRISKSASDFMKKNNYAPSLIFHEALKDLGYKENGNSKI